LQAERFPTFEQCGGEYKEWIQRLNAASSYMTKLQLFDVGDGAWLLRRSSSIFSGLYVAA